MDEIVALLCTDGGRSIAWLLLLGLGKLGSYVPGLVRCERRTGMFPNRIGAPLPLPQSYMTPSTD